MPATTVDITVDNHPAQQAFIEDRNAETGYVGGVGSGKTAGGVLRVARHVADWNEGHTGVIVSPTVPMLRNVIIPELKKWGLLDQPGIEYPNGSTVILESANNDRKIERLRGLNLAWAWMDEAAYHPAKVYQILNDRLRVGNYRNLFVTTTPRGFNWLYEEFGDIEGETEAVADGRLTRNAHTTAIVGVSTRSNPANPEDYIEREERQHSGQSYRREIEGEFVQFEGLVYPWFDDANVAPPPETYDEVIYGVDWGHGNPAVILPIARTGTVWTVIDEFYQRRVTINDHVAEAERMVDAYGTGPFYCDPSEPANIETFERNGLDARAATNDVLPGIQHVASFADSLYVAPRCQNLRNEFSQYQFKDEGESDKPIKKHDHALDALRYGLFTHTRDDGEEEQEPWIVTQR